MFYNNEYENAASDTHAEIEKNNYVETAKTAAGSYGVEEYVKAVIKTYGLQHAKVLEVGSGSGALQDFVADYTGLDIAKTAATYYHKPFVAASADAIPFPDNTFDVVWSIWLLEHVPNPEKVLNEMRRVLKPNGLLLLRPAWNCSRWASEGYEVRPYSAFGIGGKVVKASIPVMKLAEALAQNPIHLCRRIHYGILGVGTRMRFHALSPNYNDYLMPDSDAAVSIDPYEAKLWFQVRGDEFLDGLNLIRINK